VDIASIVGFVSGTVFIVVSILLSVDVSTALKLYINIPSVMITFGGAFAAVLIATPINKFVTGMKAIKFVFKSEQLDTASVITKIIDLANIARKEGLLALEEAAQSMDDKFLQKGILLIVDGTDPELVRSILETEIAFIEGRHGEAQMVWTVLAAQGPAWGMIGTLIGLINMLNAMSDPSALGPSMAVALITTLYGSLLSNFVCNPVAWKLKSTSSDEILLKEVMIEGMLSIQAGENPRIIEEKLKVFLSPTLRASMEASSASEESGGEK
jgi:chemotaxis protein MotA